MKKINEFDLFALKNNITKIVYNMRTKVYTFVGWHNGKEQTLGQVIVDEVAHPNYVKRRMAEGTDVEIGFIGSTIYSAHLVKFTYFQLEKIVSNFIVTTRSPIIIVGGRRARLELKK